ncbi:AAA family ATPase [Orrella sp. 11846]|uniref:AAA family ATPase n=1 Tax=Orrella sp. 11846 TaxID=3409913 RepID=UPI003B59478E
MKILKISFSNLNSLRGEWCIDLQDPAYLQEGLFAITGPTGAGKTTILDAICLALYASTPRLGPIGGAQNDLMTRQTGSCHAEVVFETPAGRFVSYWGQRRAYNKPDGKLQQAHHEVSTADHEILTSRLRESSQKVIELTGMTFEQFTKSMLLAQGEFSAFLDARESERAPILEQITGTEIYSQISMAVHRQRNEQQMHLQLLQTALQGTVLLSEEEQTQIQQEVAQLTKRLEELNTQIRSIQVRLQHWDTWAQIEKELTELQTQQQTLIQKREAFASKYTQLNQAQRAQTLDGAFLQVQTARQELQADVAECEKCSTDIQTLEVTLPTLETKQRQTQADWTSLSQRLEVLKPRVLQVTALDEQMADKRQSLQQAQTTLETARAALNRDVEQLDEVFIARAQMLAKQTVLMRQAQFFEADAVLSTDWSGLQQQLLRLKSETASLQKLAAQANELKDREQTLTTCQKETNQVGLRLETQLNQHKTQVSNLTATLEQWLQGASVHALHQRFNTVQTHQQKLERAQALCQEITRLQAQDLTSETDIQQDRVRLGALQTEQAHAQTAYTLAQSQLQLLQDQRAFAQTVLSYEEARQHLHVGEPCPLCGSEVHPYVHETVPKLDALLEQIQTARQAVQDQHQTLRQAETALSGLQQKLSLSLKAQETNRQTLTQKCMELQQSLTQFERTAELATVEPKSLSVLESQLSEQLQQTKTALDDLRTRQAKADELQQPLQAAQNQLQAVQEKQQAHQQQLQTLAVKHSALVRDLENHQQNWAQAQEAITQLRETLVPVLLDLDIHKSDLDEPDRLMNTLAQRREVWLRIDTALTQTYPDVAQVNYQLERLLDQVEQNTHKVQDLQADCQRIQQAYDTLLKQRLDILPDADPHQQLEMLQAQCDAASQLAQQARDVFLQTQAALRQQRDNLVSWQARLIKRRESLAILEETFARQCSEQGFADEAAYQAARLSREQIQVLLDAQATLSRQETTLRANQQTLLSKKQALQSQLANESPVEVLQINLQDADKERADLQGRDGALREQLSLDEKARAQHAQQITQIEALQTVCARWQALHDLIGSADGQKFQRFAQGLTFERVIRHANAQLQVMTDRYVLKQSRLEPLALDVVDLYQAGEVRTTRNLSGGERFIVSLALALGLSRMASHKVRVDSLFLDEGFGTLDEEALETALQALAGLRQEGKMIGIISHVQALKERIGAQILVKPVRGGYSVVEGPGCSRVSVEDL